MTTPRFVIGSRSGERPDELTLIFDRDLDIDDVARIVDALNNAARAEAAIALAEHCVVGEATEAWSLRYLELIDAYRRASESAPAEAIE